jgi:CarD family transcriptional regulator
MHGGRVPLGDLICAPSYSERQLFEQAMDRMSREIGAVNKLTLTEAVQLIEKNLQKSPRRGPRSDSPDAEEAAA